MEETVRRGDPYADNAELVEAVLNVTCRSHGLAPDHADEFSSWARIRLLDNDRATLRKFRGQSSFRTFLVTVVEHLFLDWRNHEWGKWRPTAEARRLGQTAIELERLVLRDRCSFGEASALLIERGVAASAEECDSVWARLPRQPSRHRVDEDQLVERAAPTGDTDVLTRREVMEQRTAMLESLHRAIGSLAPQDQLIIRLRYWSGIKVSRIASLTEQPPKRLYRHFEKLVGVLRDRLIDDGVGADPSDLDELLTGIESETGSDLWE